MRVTFCILRNSLATFMEKFYLNLSNPKLRLKFELIIRNCIHCIPVTLETMLLKESTTRDAATKDMSV